VLCKLEACLLVLLFLPLQIATAEELYVACWNVENLFDLRDDPSVEGDEEFTPEAPKHWTRERLDIKLANLAKVISKMNGDRGPDVLGLIEVENHYVLRELVRSLAPLKRNYKIVHQDSPSDRGIDCALLYDADRLSLRVSSFHFVDAENTRDIVEAALVCNGNPLHVFVNHWPSRSGNPESYRIKAAKTLRQRLDELLTLDPQADVLVLGDLNDYPTNDSVKVHLKAAEEPQQATGGAFYNSMWPIHRQGRGTYVFENKWEVIDHVILSPGLLDTQRLRWKSGSTQTVLFDFQLFQSSMAGAIARPNRSFSGDRFHATGISDHLPVACVLEY
jgi:predicted extracellular nuclease